MKKHLSFAIALLTLLSVFASCEKTTPAKPTISVNPTSVQFSSDGGTAKITVTTNQETFSFSGADTWLTVTKNGNVLDLSAAANTGTSGRECTLTIQAGEASTTVEVSQDKGITLEGSYSNEKLALVVNYVPVTSKDIDYPEASVTIYYPENDNTSCTVTLNNIVTGNPSVEIPCAVGTKAVISFEGSSSAPVNGKNISVSGEVSDGVLTLSLLEMMDADIVGKWMIAPNEVFNPMTMQMETLPFSYISSNDPGTEQLLPMVNYLLAKISSMIFPLYDYHQFDSDCIMKIGYTDNHSGRTGKIGELMQTPLGEGVTLETLLNMNLRYFLQPDMGLVHLNVPTSFVSMINQMLAQEEEGGISIELPIPFDIPALYKVESGALKLFINDEMVKPAVGEDLAMIMGLLVDMEYSDLLQLLSTLDPKTQMTISQIFASLGIDENSFLQFKQMVLGLLNLLINGTYEIGAVSVPYENVLRPWEAAMMQ